MDKNKVELTPLDVYLNAVFAIILILVPLAALCASITYTLFKVIGWYSFIPVRNFVIFDLVDIFFLLLSIYIVRTSKNEDGIIQKEKLLRGKQIVCLLIVLQWNMITYFYTPTEFWSYSFFFIILTVLFFDIKLTFISAVGVLVSMFISWFIKGDLLPNDDSLFIANVLLRVIALVLTIGYMHIIVIFGKKYLIKELEKYFNYDTLTHLLNRRCMNTYLEAAHKSAVTGKSVFCLILLDIDDFKHVNDTYGHDCGDEVLKTVSKTVQSLVGKNDVVFRWGGEEILMLINSDKEETVKVAENIRKTIENTEIRYDGNVIRKTVTIGVSSYSKNATLSNMLKDADEKLYYGKNHGKNQVVSEMSET
jgi:diguanylate cyclase (GGDEF)-like protein